MSRTKRSAANFISQTILSKVTMLVGFVATPLLLQWMGSEKFGVYKILLQWFSYLAIFELILNASTLGCITQPLGRGETDQVKGLMMASLRLGYRWLPVLFAVGGFWVYFLPELIKTESISHSELRWAGAGCLAMLFFSPFTCLRALTDASQKSYFISLTNTLRGLFVTLGTLPLAFWGVHLSFFVMMEFAAQALVTIAFVIFALRILPGLFRHRPRADEGSKIKKLSGPVLISAVSDQIGLVGDNLIVAWMMGANVVTPFFLTQRLGQLAYAQLLSIGNSTWAGLIELRTQGNQARFEERTYEITKLIGAMWVVIVVPLAIGNKYFMALWVGAAQYSGDLPNYIFFLNICLGSVLSFWGWLIGGVGLQREWVPFAIAGNILNIGLSIVGCYYYGYIGPLIGTLTEFLVIRSGGLLLVLKRHYQLRRRRMIVAVAQPLALSALYGFTLQKITASEIFAIDSWFKLALFLVCCGSIGLGLSWTLLLNKEDQLNWLTRLKRIIKQD